ncbi:MAG: DegT/DnrJ/EryC1/StrS family aminotransferase, partial [Trueperaceae bacterium]
AQRLTSRTQAIVVTHIWGHPVNMTSVLEFAQKHNLRVLEDCSHAHGAEWNNQLVGTFGDVAVFSLGTKKMVTGGKAGVLVTRKPDIYDRALVFGQPKHRTTAQLRDTTLKPYAASGFGVNLRGSPLAALLVIDHLERLACTIEIKNKNLTHLERSLSTIALPLTAPSRDSGWTHGTWYMYQTQWVGDTPSRDLIVAALKAEGVRVSKPEKGLHQLAIFQDPSMFQSSQLGSDPLCDPHEYPVTDTLLSRLVTWDTREMYDDAAHIIDSYELAIGKVVSHRHLLSEGISA